MRRVRNTKIRLFPTLPPSESPSAPPFPTLRAPSAARHAVRLFPARGPTLPGTQSDSSRHAVRPTAAQTARGHACGPALSVASSAGETPQRGPFTPNFAEKPLQRGFIMFRGRNARNTPAGRAPPPDRRRCYISRSVYPAASTASCSSANEYSRPENSTTATAGSSVT